MNRYQELTPYQVAEIIQGRFSRDDYDELVSCNNRNMTDILGSDWASGRGFDAYTPVDVFYDAVRSAATRKYGELPF